MACIIKIGLGEEGTCSDNELFSSELYILKSSNLHCTLFLYYITTALESVWCGGKHIWALEAHGSTTWICVTLERKMKDL